ncbi:alpha/beta hydrolase [Saccharopolyspora sp. HNM0983]|uniref:Alpha/beta hydrolase n=2 Tax=Saccharopolyspora montiporae TaxID=2781240 RepID=A0A929BDR6_9PSEU|nr:alpha/beta hydrolase [Saccharopolyspora sp. HNM0983]
MAESSGRELVVEAGGGLRLWSRSCGAVDAAPVLLVMGANASSAGWPAEFVQALVAQGLRVVRYDHRDTGRSTRAAVVDYSVEDLARDAVAVLDAHGIATAHVVGMSMGGALGQVLALDHRERLRSLVLMQTAALDVDFAESMRAAVEDGDGGGLPGPSPQVVAAFARRDEPVADVEEALRRRVAEWRLLVGDAVVFDEQEFRRWELAAIEHAGSLVQPGAHARARPVAVQRGRELAGVSTPVLVVEGGQDPVNPPPHGRHLAELIPAARCVQVPELGHALPGVLHERLVSLIVDHIGRSGW